MVLTCRILIVIDCFVVCYIGSYSAALNNAVSSLQNAGYIVVVSAGNSAIDGCSQSTTGASPASTTNSVAIGAMNQDDQFCTFSNYGSCITTNAPGQSVISSWSTSTTSYAVVSGTSMSAPITAGVIALYLSQNPSTSHTSIRNKLSSSASTNELTDVPDGTINGLLYVSLV